MKKIISITLALAVTLACNNTADTRNSSDSANYQNDKATNNRNSTVYDSFAADKREGDTSSYEQMPNKISE